MQLKVIGKDKVKVLIEDKDTEPVIVNDPDCKQKASREFILGILGEIYDKTGIDFSKSKILIEIISGVLGSYYIVITRLPDDVEHDNSVKADEDMYLFELYAPENIFDISDAIDRFPDIRTGKSRMYKYKNKYYLSVYFPPHSVSNEQFEKLIKCMCEFSEKCRWNLFNECILSEWGELLSDNPIKKVRLLPK